MLTLIRESCANYSGQIIVINHIERFPKFYSHYAVLRKIKSSRIKRSGKKLINNREHLPRINSYFHSGKLRNTQN